VTGVADLSARVQPRVCTGADYDDTAPDLVAGAAAGSAHTWIAFQPVAVRCAWSTRRPGTPARLSRGRADTPGLGPPTRR